MAGLGAALRAAPLFTYGTYASRPDYDDGVNFAAATLLTQGVLPYRDFFYAHPPGGPLFLAPVALVGDWLGPRRAFALAGLAVVAVGALTTFLLGRLCGRLWGPVAGVAAAALYAVHPEVLVAERTTFMEPVLNLACVAAASVWLSGPGVSRRRALVAGLVGGLAVGFKAWGLAWVLAGLLSAPRDDRRAVLARFAGGATAAFLAVTLPLALVDLGGFVDGTVRFHLLRPLDGTMSSWARVHEMLGFQQVGWDVAAGRHAATGLLALAGLAVALVRARRASARGERMLLAATGATVAMFLSGQSYYSHYNSHRALAEAALAGLAVGALWRLGAGRAGRVAAGAGGGFATAVATARRVVGAVVLAAVVGFAGWLSVEEGLDDARRTSPELVALGHEVARLPAGECVYVFEPTWAFAGGRVPDTPPGGPVVIDPYGAMIFAAVEDGADFPDLGALFADERSQRPVREAMAACRFVVAGSRGDFQLSAASKQWLEANYLRRAPGSSPVDIWERRSQVPPPPGF